jgi:hypothetical protein
MNWIDIRFQKPKQADADSGRRVICLLENGDTTLQFWDKVFVGQTSAIAWLDPKTLPKFEPIPEPPEGYRWRQNHDEFTAEAMVWIDGRQWVKTGARNDYCDGFIYAVPLEPPKSAIGKGYRSADYRDKDRTDVEYWDSLSQRWKQRHAIKVGYHFDPSLSYRVPADPPKSQYRPFAGVDEWLPYKDREVVNSEQQYQRWLTYTKFAVRFPSGTYSWEEAFKVFKFADGTPFGVLAQDA